MYYDSKCSSNQGVETPALTHVEKLSFLLLNEGLRGAVVLLHPRGPRRCTYLKSVRGLLPGDLKFSRLRMHNRDRNLSI